MKYTSIFSYYGSKSKIAHRYPAPRYQQIIEPFGGAGAYSLRNAAEHDVWINDLDPVTFGIWSFLQSPDALEWVARIPDNAQPGEQVSELVPNAPPGLLAILRAEANQGTQGRRGINHIVTWMGSSCWHRIKPKLRVAIPTVRTWRITNLAYNELPELEATWFIDPPYANSAGSLYRTKFHQHLELGEWCRQRRGQVIVCENEGSDWLPFRELCPPQGVMGRTRTRRTPEMIWNLDLRRVGHGVESVLV